MKRPKQRTRELSTQNYRRSKLSYQNISHNTKKTTSDKCRQLNKEISCDEFHKVNPLGPKLPISITSTSWCLYNEKTQQFLGFRQSNQREVASLTKIMTAIVSLNLIERYELDKDLAVRVSRTAAMLNGTSAQLKFGKWLKLEDLLYGAMLPSGNDAAYLLSQVLGLLLFYERMKPQDKQYVDIQSIDITLYDNTIPFVNRFLKEMNKQAKQLKMYRTSYANPHGLANILNFSTAKDMLELCKYSMGNKQFRKIINTETYECQTYMDDFQELYQVKVWHNTNKLLKKGWQGVKTGQTVPAGACLSSYREGVFIILLNCQTMDARFSETQGLFDWYESYCDHRQKTVM